MREVKQASWREKHLERLRYLFGENYRRWNGKHKDDRALYCDLYESMEAALRCLQEEPIGYVAAAMDAQLRKDRNTMGRITEKFKILEKYNEKEERSA